MINESDENEDADKMRDYYDFSDGQVGKYYERYQRGTNVVLLDEDVRKDFPTSEAVNDALRRYREMVKTHQTR